jgi:hypothetical protein
MARIEAIEYLVLALLTASAVHTVFSFFLGWKEYTPLLPGPSLLELLGTAAQRIPEPGAALRLVESVVDSQGGSGKQTSF